MFVTILALGIIPMWFVLIHLYRYIENVSVREVGYSIKEIGFWFCVSLFWPMSVPFLSVAAISERNERLARRSR